MGFDIASIGSALLSPITGLLGKKEERKQAHQEAMAALHEADRKRKQTETEGEIKVELGDQALETILAGQLSTSWKDEYITLSFVGIINAIVLGGILQGFGYPQFMAGVLLGVTTLSQLIDLKWCMTAVVMSGIGLSVWRKL